MKNNSGPSALFWGTAFPKSKKWPPTMDGHFQCREIILRSLSFKKAPQNPKRADTCSEQH